MEIRFARIAVLVVAMIHRLLRRCGDSVANYPGAAQGDGLSGDRDPGDFRLASHALRGVDHHDFQGPQRALLQTQEGLSGAANFGRSRLSAGPRAEIVIRVIR